MNSASDRSSGPARRAPRWDTVAIRAGAFVALAIAAPLWIAGNWAMDGERRGLTALFTLGALVGFVLGAACAAWVQQLGLPLAHGIVTSVGTYLAVQVAVTCYRLVTSSDIDVLRIMFFVTLAALAGLIGGLLGMRLRAAGFVPSSQRRIDHLTSGGPTTGEAP